MELRRAGEKLRGTEMELRTIGKTLRKAGEKLRITEIELRTAFVTLRNTR